MWTFYKTVMAKLVTCSHCTRLVCFIQTVHVKTFSFGSGLVLCPDLCLCSCESIYVFNWYWLYGPPLVAKLANRVAYHTLHFADQVATVYLTVNWSWLGQPTVLLKYFPVCYFLSISPNLNRKISKLQLIFFALWHHSKRPKIKNCNVNRDRKWWDRGRWSTFFLFACLMRWVVQGRNERSGTQSSRRALGQLAKGTVCATGHCTCGEGYREVRICGIKRY